jgi:hypothetical protein
MAMHEAVRFTLSDHFPLYVCGVVSIVIHVCRVNCIAGGSNWWKYQDRVVACCRVVSCTLVTVRLCEGASLVLPYSYFVNDK